MKEDDIFAKQPKLNDILFYIQTKKKELDLEFKRKLINLLNKQTIEEIAQTYEQAIIEYLKKKEKNVFQFLELICHLQPDLLYCTLKGREQSLADKIMTNRPLKELDTMIDVLQIQKFQLKQEIGHHPKSLEIFFNYYFCHFRKEGFKKEKSIQFVGSVLKSMIKNATRVSHPDFKLPLISISVFNSLLNYCFLDHPGDTEMYQVYQHTKYLLFSTSHNCVLTNHPSAIFTTLMGPLGQVLDPKIKEELLDILALLLTTRKDISDQIFSTWIQKYENYVTESGILIAFLLEERRKGRTWFSIKSSARWKKLRQSNMSKASTKLLVKTKELLKKAKGNSKSKLIQVQKDLKALQRLTVPGFGKAFVKKLLHFIIHILIVSFLFYSLVYVQCDPKSSRKCPLPFDPQQQIEKVKFVLREKAFQYGPYAQRQLDHAQGILDQASTWSKQTVLLVKPQIVSITNTVANANIVKQVYAHPITSTIIRFVKNDVTRPITAFWTALMIKYEAAVTENDISEIRKGSMEWKQKLSFFLKQKLPVYLNKVKEVWHTQCVFFVDVFIPFGAKYAKIAASNIGIAARAIRKQIVGFVGLGSEVVVYYVDMFRGSTVYRAMLAHPLIEKSLLLYQLHLAEYVTIFSQYLGHGLRIVVNGIDFLWAILEGRITLDKVNSDIVQMFQRLFSFFNK